MWIDSPNLELFISVFLTTVGLLAAIAVNIAYFFKVLPFMRRRRGKAALGRALFGPLALEQMLEYCRLARTEDSRHQRRVAVAIKVGLAVFAVAFVLMAVVVLLHNLK